MRKTAIIKKLREDEHYYGKYGQQFLSNSNISALLEEDPIKFRSYGEQKLAYVWGSYFHTMILEPHKLDKFIIINADSRRTREYKDQANGNICLLTKDVEHLNSIKEKLLYDDRSYHLIREGDVEYELPGFTELEGLNWKGKADIVNNTRELVIDLKSTRDTGQFMDSIFKFNYDSQAYIYSKIFGYRLTFIAVGKSDGDIKVIESTDEMLESGADKVKRASDIYKEWFH